MLQYNNRHMNCQDQNNVVRIIDIFLMVLTLILAPWNLKDELIYVLTSWASYWNYWNNPGITGCFDI